MTQLRKFFNQIQSIGIRSDMDEYTVRRIRMLNLFYVITVPAFIASTIQTFLVDGVSQGWLMVAGTFFFAIGFLFSKFGFFRVAELYLIFVANITVFYFNNVTGSNSGVFLYYFPLLMMIAFLSDFRNTLGLVVDIVLVLFFVFASAFFRYDFLYDPTIPDAVNESSFVFNLILSGLLIGYCTFVIIRMNYREFQVYKMRIDERRMAENQAKIALREKETLLAEVHHRVKNNLAVINSLLNLQMNMVDSVDARAALRESRNRVSSMALIHRKLYRNSNFEEIDMRDYISELVDEIRQSYPEHKQTKIKLNLDAAQIKLELTSAIPCGLILNELLSNCFKHAFNGRTEGTINVQFVEKDEQACFLSVRDNGVGLPEAFDLSIQNSLGLTLIESLCGQLDGKFSYASPPDDGTCFELIFHRKSHTKKSNQIS
jgi:two-component sensor histidine kinase